MAPAPISVLLFDWDGTLMDSASLGRHAFQQTFAELQIPFSQESYETIYSPNWYSMYEALGLPREKWPQADELWLRHYGEETPAFVEGAEETMIELRRRGYRFGLVSSGTCSRVHREVQALGVAGLFETLVCNEMITHKKPHPEGLQKAIGAMGCVPGMCAYVGDSPEDIQMSKSAGAFAVGVPGAYPTSKHLPATQPDLLIASIRELLEHFRGLDS